MMYEWNSRFLPRWLMVQPVEHTSEFCTTVNDVSISINFWNGQDYIGNSDTGDVDRFNSYSTCFSSVKVRR